jgi:uncharacterized protein (DUF58 family)
MTRPTRRFVLLFASGLGAAAIPASLGTGWWPAWAGYVAVCAAAAAVDLAMIPTRRGIDVAVETPLDIAVGGTGAAWIRINVSSRRSLGLDVQADLSRDLVPQPLASGRLAGTPVRVPLTLRPLRRGTVAVEGVWVRVVGPLGLMTRVLTIAIDRRIDVLPNVTGGAPRSIRFEETPDQLLGAKIQRFDGSGSEFDTLREFREGDDHRTIDWKASARHRTLLRRQFRAERDHQVILALDTGRLMAARLHGIPKLDHAVGAALRLAHVALRTGDRVGLFGFDEKPRVRPVPRGGLRAHARLLRAAAALEAREVETNFTLGLATLLQSLRRRSLIVILTDFADSVSAELMVESLRRAGRRHVVVFVALADAALEAIETASPVDRRTLHRAVVAGTLRRERTVVLERLRRLGIHPIETTPERLGAEMISRYLELKRREAV